MAVLGLNLVVIRSVDIHRAVRMYQALGLTFTLHAHGQGPEHYSAEIGEFVFEIYPASSKVGDTRGTRLGSKVSSVEESLSAVVNEGAEVIAAPADSPWGRRAVVRDRDGHAVELSS